MSVLNDNDRKVLWAKFMSDLSREREIISVDKNELRNVVDAIDIWIDNNMASFNNAIPEPAKSNLSTKQKAMILMYIVNRRWEVI